MDLSRTRTTLNNSMACRRTDASTSGGFCQDCAVHTRAFCAVLDDDALSRLEQLHTIVNLESEDGLFMEGDDATYFFTVLSGALRLSKLLPDGRRQITGFVLPGEFIGLSLGDTYVDNAEALTDASLCRFSVSDLERIGQENPEMGGRLLAMTNGTLTQARDHMLLLGRMKAPEKIASFLISLMDRADAADQQIDPLHLPMSRADIADYLGLTIETVSRTFTRLKVDKVVSLPEHNRVQIENMEALIELAAG